MIARQLPSSAVLLGAKIMARPEVPPEHQPAPTAFEAHDELLLNRPSYRNRGRTRGLVEFGRFTEASESLMHGRNQGWQLFGRYWVVSEISADNPACEL